MTDKEKITRREGIEFLMQKYGFDEKRAASHYREYGLGESTVTRFYIKDKDGWRVAHREEAGKYAKG